MVILLLLLQKAPSILSSEELKKKGIFIHFGEILQKGSLQENITP